MKHPRVDVTRVKDLLEFPHDRGGGRRGGRGGVDEGEDVRHVLVEEGEGHLGVEGVDRGGEGLTAPYGSNERLACRIGEL